MQRPWSWMPDQVRHDEQISGQFYVCFLLIWISIAVFSFDMWRKMRAERMVAVA